MCNPEKILCFTRILGNKIKMPFHRRSLSYALTNEIRGKLFLCDVIRSLEILLLFHQPTRLTFGWTTEIVMNPVKGFILESHETC